jgi:hypothetical protein
VNLPSWAEEGFCELLSYRYYQTNPGQVTAFYAERIEQSVDPVYGGGFRQVAAIARRIGFTQLLATLQNSKAMPG